jgi:tetratricopeptide (TPR) repeat protein
MMESRKAAAGLSINRMLDATPAFTAPAEASLMVHPVLEATQQMSQMAMPMRSVRVKPVHDAPTHIQTIPSQMAAPSMRVRPLLDQPEMQSPPPQINYNALSNIAMPSLRVAPVLQAPPTQINQDSFGIAQFDPFQQAPQHIQQLQQLQQQQMPPPPPPPQIIQKANRQPRPTLSAQELLSSLKLWSTSLSPPDIKPAGKTDISSSLVHQAAETLAHASTIVCLLTNGQIQKELKSLQELLDAGFIQPMEFETRRFRLQTMSKNALVQAPVPHVDANRALAPMMSVSSTTSGAHVSSSSSRKHIRVFVSSTFKDMSEERDTLMKNVFPQLQRECKKRGIVLTAVDLRWGITSEQTNAGNTVNICLSEIDRSQYFLCMLGSRYGWAQPLDAPAVDLGSAITAPRQDELLKKSMQQALPSYPWIRSYAQCSVTELEVRHAVLNRPDADIARRSLFMMRSNVTDEDMRLTSLKRDIQTVGSNSKTYGRASTEDFGASVLKSLLSMILADFPEADASQKVEETPVQRERVPHQAFEDSRCRFFIPRESDFQALDSHLASSITKPLAVVADEGLGKSAFLANFAARYRSAHPERLLITHYVGCTAASADLTNVLKRMIGELWTYAKANEVNQSEKGVSDDLEMPTDMAGLIDKFIALLTVAGARYGGGVTIVVDAINQLSSQATTDWIPAVLPPGVSFILSAATSSQHAMGTLDKIGAIRFELTPLSVPEREGFISGFMKVHAKTLKPSQLAALSQAAPCSNPLFLRTLLEELRVFGSFEQLDTRIGQYLSAKDATQLFEMVLQRLDTDTQALVGSEAKSSSSSSFTAVGSVLTSIYASRNGMTETELVKMHGLTPNLWATISLALEEMLVDSSGTLTFFHDCVRHAVARRYLEVSASGRSGQAEGASPTNAKILALHKQLASFFSQSPPAPKSAAGDAEDPFAHRFYEELPYQYERAAAWTELQNFIAAAEHFLRLQRPDFRYDLYRYWRALPTHMNDACARLLMTNIDSYVANVAKTEDEKDDALDKTALFFKDLGQYSQAEELYKKAIVRRSIPMESILKTGDVDLAKRLADRLEHLGYVLRLAGKYSDASKVYRLALDAKRKLTNNQDSAFLATSINSLAILCRKQGNYEEASKLYHEALEMRKRLFGQVHVDIAQSYNSLGCLLQDQGKYAEAAEMLKEAVRQRETLMGKTHPDVAMSLLNLGNVYLDWSRYTDAEPIYERSLAIYEATFGPEHPNVALVLNSFAGLYQEMGQFEKSIPMYVRNLETKIKMLGAMHPDLALAYNDIAVLCSRKDNNALAEDFFNGALKIRSTVLGTHHPDFAQSLQNLGSIYQQEGLYGMALPLFKQALGINEKAFGPQHPNVASAATSIGGLLQLMGPDHYGESVEYYKRSLAIYTAICAHGKPDSDLALTCNDLAIVYVKMGRFSEAEAMYLDALKHYTGCFGPDHPDVAQALKNLGSFYTNPAAKDKAKALEYLGQSVQVFESTLGHSHARTLAARDLFARAQAL